MTSEQAELAFSKWLSKQDFGEHPIIANTGWQSVDLPGDKPGSKKGAAKLTYDVDKIEGVFFDRRAPDDLFTWHPGNGALPNLTDEECRALAEKAERNASKTRKAQEAARTRAKELYRQSPAATPDHPYLLKKKIADVGRLKADGKDLLVPIYNVRTDEFQTYQRIKPDGAKPFPKNAVKVGGYTMLGSHPIIGRREGKRDKTFPIIICEGYATAYAIHSTRFTASPLRCDCVISALDAGNLKVVAEALHDRFPDHKFIIAADNDIVPKKPGHNPGVTGAMKAASAIGCKIAISPLKDPNTSGDFWDFWNKDGDAAVKKLIDEASEPSGEVAEPMVEQDSATDESPQPPLQQNPPPKQHTRKGKTFSLVCAKDIIVRPKQWLWEGHLLRGAQELLTGLPGLGKSQVQISLVACVTAGLPWPNGGKGMSPANVIMLTAEDTLDQEVIPRLIAAGANLERVQILKCIRSDGKDRQFLLGEDLDALERAANQVGDVALITIDPITAYMGKIDSHKTTDVRSQLGPLKDFAERVNLAVSTITHPAKNTSQKAIDQFIGSQAFIAAGRIGHVCIREVLGDEAKETGRILFTNAKNNPHTKMPTLAFRIAEDVIGQDPDTRTNLTAPHVVWEKDAVNITADEAVRAASNTGGGGKKNTEQNAAQEFLKEILGEGEPVPVKVIHAEGHKRGFSGEQLKLARKKLGDIAVVQIRGGWTWQMMM